MNALPVFVEVSVRRLLHGFFELGLRLVLLVHGSLEKLFGVLLAHLAALLLVVVLLLVIVVLVFILIIVLSVFILVLVFVLVVVLVLLVVSVLSSVLFLLLLHLLAEDVVVASVGMVGVQTQTIFISFDDIVIVFQRLPSHSLIIFDL